MNNDNKYYTPEIDEFHIGFEYEYLHNEEWISYSVAIEDVRQNNPDGVLEYIDCILQTKEVRVKYLDEDDIKDLGFTKHVSGYIYNPDKLDTEEFRYKIHFLLSRKADGLYRSYIQQGFGFYFSKIFEGTIKNKSELRKLMKQLNIQKIIQSDIN